MTGTQTIAGLAGAGLIVTNWWTGNQHAPIVGVLSKSANGKQLAAAHTSLVEIGGELVFVLVAVVIAGTGPGAGKAVVAAIAALWILWAIHHYGGTKSGASSTPSTPKKISGTVAGAAA